MEQYTVLVAAVVIDAGSVLLLQRSRREKFLPERWGLPAGKVMYGEHLEDAALRELREEAGIDGKVERTTGCSWFESDVNQEKIRNMQVNFVVRVASRSITLDRSNQDYMWLDLTDLDDPPVPLDEFTRSAICSALPDDTGLLGSKT